MVERSDPYAELGVAPGATDPEIREAFRRRLREHHPDTRRLAGPEDDRESDEALQRTLAAYAALRRTQQQNQRPGPAPPPGSVVRSTRPRPSSQGPALEASPVQWEPADVGLFDDRNVRTSRISLSTPLLPAMLLRRWLLRDWGRR